MATSPCSSANIADEMLYGDENHKFVSPVENSTSPYLTHLSSVSTDVSSIVSSSQHPSIQSQHFLAQKYAAESTSDGDLESHSNSVNHLPHSSQAFQHQISNFYPFSPLVSSSSHFDTRGILGEGVLESSVDSLQVESSTNEQQSSGHSSNHSIFNESITSIDNFIKPEDAVANLPIVSTANVTSSSNRANATESDLCRVEIVPSSLFDTINNDVTVDSTTTANISTANSINSPLPSFSFNSFQTSNLNQPPLSSVLSYGLSPNFSSTLLQIDNSQQLLPPLSSPSIPIDQYFNHPNSLEKREDYVILDQHQLLPSTLQQFSNENHCLLVDNNLSDNFIHDIQHENFNENEIVNSQEIVISDLPVLTRARASLPIQYLYINETDSGPGVFAIKSIPKRTQFGPIEGVIVSFAESQYSLSSIAYSSKNSLIIFISESVLLSQADENNSNWTRFVRPACNAEEQNVELITREFTNSNELKFYFYTTRNILQNEELKVWYSKEYADRFNIKPLESSEHLNLIADSELDSNNQDSLVGYQQNNLTTGGHKLRNKIAKSQLTQMQHAQMPLNECSKLSNQVSIDPSMNGNDMQDLFNSTIDVVSNEHVSDNNERIGNNSSVENNFNQNNLDPKSKEKHKFQCDKCQRVFPRHYSLRRHQIMHSGEKRYKCPVCGMAFNHVYNRNRHIKMHKTQLNDSSKDKVNGSSDNGSNENATLPNRADVDSSGANNQNVVLINSQSVIQIAESPDANPKQLCSTVETNSGSPKNNSLTDNVAQDNETNDETNSSSDLMSIKIESSSGSDKVTSSNGDKVSDSNKNSTQGKLYRCSQCYKRFSTEERLEKHIIVHDESAKKLSCDICKRKFLTNSALTCHIKYHKFSANERRTYDCILCDKVFENIQSRRQHVTVHINSESGLYHCPKCSKTFREFSIIRKHLKSFHSEEIFPCTHCPKVFPRQDKLRLHMLCHIDRWEFKCNFCEKQFKRKDKLKEHTQRMHAPDRDIRIAAKLAARMQRLNVQRTRKVPTRPTQPNYHEFVYKCHQCLLGFKRRGMLVNHLAKRHPDVPYNSVPELNMPIVKTSKDYYCQYCDKVYKSSSKRKVHILKNHPGKSLPPSNRKRSAPSDAANQSYSATVGSITTNPHFCDWCHKQYASKAKLLQHQRKKHQDKIQNTSPSKQNPNSPITSSTSSSSTNIYKFNSIISDKTTFETITLNSDLVVKSEQNTDSEVVKIEMNYYTENKMDSFLSSDSPNCQSYIENFDISNNFSKNDDVYLNGNLVQQSTSQAQYTIDSSDQSFEELLSIVPDGHHSNLNATSTSNTPFSNNIITILGKSSLTSNSESSVPSNVTNQNYSNTVESLAENQSDKRQTDTIQNSSPSKQDSSSPEIINNTFNSIITDKSTFETIPANSDSVVKTEPNPASEVVKIEMDFYNDNKIDTFLSNASPNCQSYIESFDISNNFSKNDDIYLNGNLVEQSTSQAQYTIDSSDQSFEELLSIVPDGHHPSLNTSRTSNGTFSNNIITILACTVPSNCSTFSNDIGDFAPGISDIITQITSDFQNGKQLLSTNHNNNDTSGSNDLMISDSIDDNNWNQVCEEMAI